MLSTVLTRHSLLNELDEDLMIELDAVVRQNQLACLPIVKSGKAEDDLIEKYPQLVDLMERSKNIKIDSIALQARLHDHEAKSSASLKAKATLHEDFDRSPSMPKSRSRASGDRSSQSKSPALRARRSNVDLMFEMEEDDDLAVEAADKDVLDRRRHYKANTSEFLLSPQQMAIGDDHEDERSKVEDKVAASTSPSSFSSRVNPTGKSPGSINSQQPWAPRALTTPKLDLKDIMAQASSNRVSSISAGLSFRAEESEASGGVLPTKLSQKERKKQLQQQQLRSPQVLPVPTPVPSSSDNQTQSKSSASPWQVASTGPKISLKDVLSAESTKSPLSEGHSIPRTPSPLTMRQTISGKAPAARRATSGSKPTFAPNQKRSVSTPDAPKSSVHTPSPKASRSSSVQQPIQSIRHSPLLAEPTLQLSMSDILYQQQTEKDIIKEAAAKRSLQEIQEEQAFQEWWDEESRKVREEEEQAAWPAARGGRGGKGKVRGRSRGRGRGRGGARGRGDGGERARGGGGGSG